MQSNNHTTPANFPFCMSIFLLSAIITLSPWKLIPRVLAICHTAIPKVDENRGEVSFEAESLDELPLLLSHENCGLCSIKELKQYELDPVSGEKVEGYINFYTF